MSYQTLDSTETVQVFSPTLVSDALLVTIRSFPSGSVLVRTVPQDIFAAGGTSPILASLSDAVEQELEAGIATAAAGTQALDDSGLIYDAVTFTVSYTPPNTVPGTLTATVDVPVDVLTADTSCGSFLTGGTAAERIHATYYQLKGMASG